MSPDSPHIHQKGTAESDDAAPDVEAALVGRNLMQFGRRLRQAGLPIGSGQIISFFDALEASGVERRDDVYHAARAVMTTRPEQIPAFDVEFERFWKDLLARTPMLLEAALGDNEEAIGTPKKRKPGEDEPSEGKGEAGSSSDKTMLAIEGTDDANETSDSEDFEAPPEDVLIFSARDAFRKKDFAQYTPEEIAEARRIMERMHWRLGTRRTRRKERAIRGEFIDHRAMLRSALKQGGVPVELKWRKRKEKMRPLVLICDISGSMDRYSRLLLQFVHTLEAGLDSVEVFVFGTRLTRITRELRKRDVDQAITDVVNAVDDWSGGTRIGEAIREFNFTWSRRVLRSNATVVMISDGWDRGDPFLLGTEMARLQRSCRRLIWLNPLMGAPGYQPLTQGIRAALPYVDYFLPVHNLKSLEALAELLSAVDDHPPLRRQQGAEAFRHD